MCPFSFDEYEGDLKPSIDDLFNSVLKAWQNLDVFATYGASLTEA